jgi:cytochrome bd-type quinol oxidase subunit 2
VIAAATVGAILLASVTLYAVLGGADFGGGLWDLLAGGDRRGSEPRQLVDTSITPVWEANHVWLVFDLVIFWTAFPTAFAAVMTTLALPLWLAVAGIVLRGAGFAFRKEVSTLSLQRVFGVAFALSSLMTPFFMGLAAWTGVVPVLTGLLFACACGYLAAVYLTTEARKQGSQRMVAYFTRRAQAAGIAAGALSLAALIALHSESPGLFSRLSGRALPLVILAGVCGVAVLVLLTARHFGGVRVLAALGVAAVLWGYGVARYPVLLPGTGVTLANAGAPRTTLVALIVLFVVVVLIIGPSFMLLYALHGRQVLGADGEQIATASGPAAGTLSDRGPRGQQRGSSGHPGTVSRAVAIGLAATVAIVRALSRHRRRN